MMKKTALHSALVMALVSWTGTTSAQAPEIVAQPWAVKDTTRTATITSAANLPIAATTSIDDEFTINEIKLGKRFATTPKGGFAVDTKTDATLTLTNANPVLGTVVTGRTNDIPSVSKQPATGVVHVSGGATTTIDAPNAAVLTIGANDAVKAGLKNELATGDLFALGTGTLNVTSKGKLDLAPLTQLFDMQSETDSWLGSSINAGGRIALGVQDRGRVAFIDKTSQGSHLTLTAPDGIELKGGMYAPHEVGSQGFVVESDAKPAERHTITFDGAAKLDFFTETQEDTPHAGSFGSLHHTDVTFKKKADVTGAQYSMNLPTRQYNQSRGFRATHTTMTAKDDLSWTYRAMDRRADGMRLTDDSTLTLEGSGTFDTTANTVSSLHFNNQSHFKQTAGDLTITAVGATMDYKGELVRQKLEEDISPGTTWGTSDNPSAHPEDKSSHVLGLFMGGKSDAQLNGDNLTINANSLRGFKSYYREQSTPSNIRHSAGLFVANSSVDANYTGDVVIQAASADVAQSALKVTGEDYARHEKPMDGYDIIDWDIKGVGQSTLSLSGKTLKIVSAGAEVQSENRFSPEEHYGTAALETDALGTKTISLGNAQTQTITIANVEAPAGVQLDTKPDLLPDVATAKTMGRAMMLRDGTDLTFTANRLQAVGAVKVDNAKVTAANDSVFAVQNGDVTVKGNKAQVAVKGLEVKNFYDQEYYEDRVVKSYGVRVQDGATMTVSGDSTVQIAEKYTDFGTQRTYNIKEMPALWVESGATLDMSAEKTRQIQGNMVVTGANSTLKYTSVNAGEALKTHLLVEDEGTAHLKFKGKNGTPAVANLQAFDADPDEDTNAFKTVDSQKGIHITLEDATWNVFGENVISGLEGVNNAKVNFAQLGKVDWHTPAHHLAVRKMTGDITIDQLVSVGAEKTEKSRVLYVGDPSNANLTFNFSVDPAVDADFYKPFTDANPEDFSLRFATFGADPKSITMANNPTVAGQDYEYYLEKETYDPASPLNADYEDTGAVKREDKMGHENVMTFFNGQPTCNWLLKIRKKPEEEQPGESEELEVPGGSVVVTPGQPAVTPGQPTVTPGQPTVTPGQPTVTPGQPTVTPTQPTTATTTTGVVGLPTALWWGELDTYDERVGGMYANGPSESLWARVRADYSMSTDHVKSHGSTLTIGAERHLKGFWRGSLFGDVRHAKAMIDKPDEMIRLRRWTVGAIATRTEDNRYWDLIASGGQDRYTVKSHGDRATTRAKRFVVSVEHGRRYIDKDQRFIEPQLQASVVHLRVRDYQLGNRTISTDSMTGVALRLGVKAGIDRARYKLWARADLLPRFGTKQVLTVLDGTNAPTEVSTKHRSGVGFDVGVGASRIFKNKWRLAASGFVSRNVGEKVGFRGQVSVQRTF